MIKINATVETNNNDCSGNMCQIGIRYTYNGKVYNSHVSVDKYIAYKKGNSIEVYIKKSDPSVAYKHDIMSKEVAWILLGIAIFIVIATGVSWWLTRKSKFYAGAQGAVGAIDILKSI